MKGESVIQNIKEFTDKHLTTESTNPTPQSKDIDPSPRSLSASTLIGNKVINLGRDELGTIRELIVDLTLSQISYAIISHGGFLGIGEKLFVVPWNAMVLDPDQQAFILNLKRDVFEQSEGIDRDNLPNFSDRVWGEHIHQYYGCLPYWEVPSTE